MATSPSRHVCSPRWLQSVIERTWLLLRGLKGVLLQIHTKPRADWFQILQRRTTGSDLIDFSETICWTKFKPPGQAALMKVWKKRENNCLIKVGMQTIVAFMQPWFAANHFWIDYLKVLCEVKLTWFPRHQHVNILQAAIGFSFYKENVHSAF